jgi:hypothetical protein
MGRSILWASAGYPWVTTLIERGLIPVGNLMTHHWKLAQYRDAFAAVEDRGWSKAGSSPADGFEGRSHRRARENAHCAGKCG